MKHLLAVAMVAVMVLAGFIVAMPGARAQRVGTEVDSATWFQQPNQAQALLDLGTVQNGGTMDVYMFPLRTAADIASARANPDLWTIDVGGSLNNLFVNPVPVNQAIAPGVGNPFSHRGAREALNYIIDRDFIANEIAGGSQFPHITLENRLNPEYGRDPVFMSELERKYAFNPALGSQMIAQALSGDADYSFNTATGKWLFKGNPIALDFVIRIEDIRRNIGDYVADQLENLGFGVTRDYQPGSGAFAKVYNSPSDTGAWQLYTEGWAATALTAWSDSDPNFYSCGGEGSAVWGFYTPPAALVDVCNKLLNAQYTSLAERETLFETATDLSLQDGVRVWVTSGGTFAISKRVTGMVYDLAGGPWGLLATRTARFATVGGNLQVGQRLQYLSPWNPWQGFGWLYDALQLYSFSDVPLWPHPHTGLYMPIRSTFSVDAPSPTASMPVPTDALVWDSTTSGFTTVTSGTTAKSSVTYTMTFGKWHDGSDFTMNDVLYELALVYRRVEGDVHAADGDSATFSSILLTNILKGFKVLSGNQLQVWYDYWHVDPTTIASNIIPAWPVTPWTASELALSTVIPGGATPCRISEVTAETDGKDALDMTKGPCLAAMATNLPSYFGTHRPPGLDNYITPAEAAVKWVDLENFYNTTGHFFSSNGPFVLTKVDETTKQTTMTRDPNYPLQADSYDAYLTPRIPQVSFAPAPTVLIGRPAQFTLSSRLLGGGAYDKINTTWLVVNPATGAVLFQGTPTKVAPGSYVITLTGTQTTTFQPGAYDLRTITVGDEAAIPVIAAQSFIAIPDVESIVAELRGEIQSLQNNFNQQILEQQNLTKAAQAQVASLQTLVIASMALAIIAIVVAAVVVVRAMPRKPKEGMGKPPAEEEI